MQSVLRFRQTQKKKKKKKKKNVSIYQLNLYEDLPNICWVIKESVGNSSNRTKVDATGGALYTVLLISWLPQITNF